MKNFTETIEGCLAGNHKYQRILYEQYRGYAFKIVFRYIYRYDEAAHVVNDGFIKLLNHIHTFGKKENGNDEKLFLAWLKKIMINTAIDKLRREKNTETHSLSDSFLQVPETSENADDILFYNDLIKLVKELPVAYRLVFNLHVIDGYSHIEISELIHIPVSTSRSNLLRARTILQKRIVNKELIPYAEYRQ